MKKLLKVIATDESGGILMAMVPSREHAEHLIKASRRQGWWPEGRSPLLVEDSAEFVYVDGSWNEVVRNHGSDDFRAVQDALGLTLITPSELQSTCETYFGWCTIPSRCAWRDIGDSYLVLHEEDDDDGEPIDGEPILEVHFKEPRPIHGLSDECTFATLAGVLVVAFG